MNYEKCYESLIKKAKNRNLKKLNHNDPNYVYLEYHHIIPQSLHGPDIKENIVTLFPKEHFIAHKLLVKIQQIKYGLYSWQYNAMITALNLMSSENKGNIKISSRTYMKIRTEFSYIQHLRLSGEGNPMYGESIKDHMTQEKYEQWLTKVRNNKNGKQNPFYGKHHTKEVIERIKNANKQYKILHGHGPTYGRKQTEEQRKHNSESHKHPYSHDRKIKQNKTIITKCCGHLCDLSEFDFELYITLKPCDKIKYRKQYIKNHPKNNKI